jgi:sulfite exporter TauE/SafE
MELTIAAFLLGLTGSLHCVGMCGPLMLAAGNGGRWQSAFAYQSGRILIYVFLGLILGSFGLGMRLWNAQSTIALLSGGLLIGFAVLRPLTADTVAMGVSTLWWGLMGLVLHGVAHYILGMMRKAETQ